MGSPIIGGRPDTDLKRKLFHFSMKGDWKSVIKEYESNSSAYSAKITRSGDTALHIAILEGKVDDVNDLVNTMASRDPAKAEEALKVDNANGNTPLHLAASLGNVEMCRCIAEKDPSLGGLLNGENETPFFLAALHGNKDAFLRLHRICSTKDPSMAALRNKEGDTILHVAILGEYFDLAFQILNLYKDLANTWNEKGMTPLHLLASKPSAFRSSFHLRGYRKLIYHCTFVDELRTDYLQIYPKNYETCVNFFKLLWKAIPEVGWSDSDVSNIKALKEKHTWSVQVMDILIEIAGAHDYESTGSRPIESEAGEETLPNVFGVGALDTEMQINPPTQGEGQGRAPDTEKKAAQESIPWKSFLSKVVDKILEYLNKPRDKDKPAESKTEASTLIARKIGTTEILKIIQKSLSQLSQPTTPVAKGTPILMAAKNGIIEIVQKILEKYPVAIHDTDANKKNIVLLAVENRQPDVYQFLLTQKKMTDSIFREVDINGNSALHLAATLGDYNPWRIPGAALQMQWEYKWFQFVKTSMPPHCFLRYNKEGKTPQDVFTETHKDLVKRGGKWLTSTAESSSVVAALIATVAFATSITVPGGVNEDSGVPTLVKEPAFNIFTISSLIALCFSVTSLILFLAILTSRHEEKDFGRDLPRKLLFGLTSLFVSIASILVSFCAAHFFLLNNKLKYAAFSVYAITCLPVTFYAVAQFSLYLDLIRATFEKVPQRGYTPFSL